MGFSFGTAVVAAASERMTVAQMILIAPPVMRYSYAPRGEFACPVTLVLGGQDENVEKDAVLNWLESLESSVATIVIPEASHFFHGQLNSLREKLGAQLSAFLTQA